MINFLIGYYSSYTLLRISATVFILIQLLFLLSFIYYEFKFGFFVSSSAEDGCSRDSDQSDFKPVIFSLKERKKRYYHNSVVLMLLGILVSGILSWILFLCVSLLFLIDIIPLIGTASVLEMIVDFVSHPVQFLAELDVVSEYTDVNGEKRRLCLPYVVTMGYVYCIILLLLSIFCIGAGGIAVYNILER